MFQSTTLQGQHGLAQELYRPVSKINTYYMDVHVANLARVIAMSSCV